MEEINRTLFGQRLYDSREAAKLTQEVAAKKVGMAQSTLAEAEISGKRSGYTSQLADLYGVSAKWLATGKRDHVTSNQSHYIEGESTRVDEKTAQLSPPTETFKSIRDRRIDELLAIVQAMSDDGLLVLTGSATEIAKQYPAQAKQTRESSE